MLSCYCTSCMPSLTLPSILLSVYRILVRTSCTISLQQIISLEEVSLDAASDTLYIVMELMECDLQRVLASGQVLPGEHVQVMLKQLLLGVQAMHRHGIIRKLWSDDKPFVA